MLKIHVLNLNNIIINLMMRLNFLNKIIANFMAEMKTKNVAMIHGKN